MDLKSSVSVLTSVVSSEFFRKILVRSYYSHIFQSDLLVFRASSWELNIATLKMGVIIILVVRQYRFKADKAELLRDMWRGGMIK